MCVQICDDWDLLARVHKPGLMTCILDLDEYDREVGLDDIITGEHTEPVDHGQRQRRTPRCPRR